MTYKTTDKLLLILVALLAGTAFAAAQKAPTDSITVEQAVQMVLAANPAVQQATHAIEASTAHVAVSRSSLYPEAGVSLNYVRLGPVAAFSFPGFGSLSLYPLDNYDEHIGASATLFDFDKRQKTIDVANRDVENAKDRLAMSRQSLAYQTIQTFYAILFLRQSIGVQDDEISTLNEHLLLTRKKVEAGTATDFDALTTQVRVATAQSQRIGLSNSLASTEISLRRLLGVPAAFPLTLAGQFGETPVSLNTDSLTQIALQNRVDMKLADDQIASARARYGVASSLDNPSLNVAFAYGFKNGYEPNIYAWRGNFAAAVQVQMPLSGVVPFFGGYRKDNMQEEASATLQGAESYKNSVAQQVAADVQKSIADLKASKDRLETADVAVQQASTALNVARGRYQAGTVTNLDLLDAETALSQAKLMRLEALYHVVIGRHELEQAIGTRTW
ncbi:MAG TPA: TolC family protein [Bacteroidota bacterium]|nr:TolC family protein [Bacteroidota bacterium]